MKTLFRLLLFLSATAFAGAKEDKFTAHLLGKCYDDAFLIEKRPIVHISNNEIIKDIWKAIQDAQKNSAHTAGPSFPAASPMAALRVEGTERDSLYIVLFYNTGYGVTIYKAKTGIFGQTKAAFSDAIGTVQARSLVKKFIDLLIAEAPATVKERQIMEMKRRVYERNRRRN